MNNNYRIEPLRRNNYDTWVLQARAVLTRNSLWKYVSGECLRPTSSKEEIAKWDSEDLNAKSELILIISPPELKQIKNCDKSKDVWDTLAKIFHSKGPARKASLLKHLILRKMKDSDDVRDHLNDFIDTVDKLNDMDVKINTDLLSIMMLYSLPASYENFRIAIESRDELPSPENLKIKIIEENEARNKNIPLTSTEGAFVTKNKYQRNNFKKSHQNKNQNVNIENVYEKNKPGTSQCQCKSKQNKNKNAKSFKVEKCYSNLNHSDKEVWCLDSGCTSHMCAVKSKFEKIIENSDYGNLKLASDDGMAEIKGSGNVKLDVNIHKGCNSTINLINTLYVPNLSTNLISVSKATESGCIVIFKKSKADVICDGKIILTARKTSNGLYLINTTETKINRESTYKVSDQNIKFWHQKLGHLNEADLIQAQKQNLLKGLKFNPSSKLGDCEICIQGKMSRLPFPTDETSKITLLLHTIHSDVWGPFRTPSQGGSRYFVTFIDSASRYCKIYFLKRKSEVLEKFKEYKNEVENSTEKKIKYLQTDNGRAEYCSNEFSAYLKHCGIQRRLSAPYTPQQHGLAERKNRTLLERARCMLIEAKLPDIFWAEAVNTANYLLNRSPCKYLNGGVPFERWAGFTPSVRHLHVFGNKTFVLKKGPNRTKLESKADEGIFMGYSETSKAYRIWLPRKRHIVISRDVKVLNKFDHNYEQSNDYDFINDTNSTSSNSINDKYDLVSVPCTSTKERSSDQTHSQKYIDREDNHPPIDRLNIDQIENQNDNQNSIDDDIDEDNNLPLPENQRPRRERRPPIWTNDYDMSFLCDEHDASEVNNDDWHEAIKSELRSHVKNGTWEVVDKKQNKNIIDYRMILKNKYHADGTLERKKARLVARGFKQRPNIDFTETYAPVARLSSIRMLLGVAAEEKMNIIQLDVTTAYLNGDIEEDIEIHMKIPAYLEKFLQEIILDESGNEDTTIFLKSKKMLEDLRRGNKNEKVCCLKKALYGLKQAGRQWFKKLDETLTKLGFKPSEADPCIYNGMIRGEKVLISVFVDDLIVASKSEIALTETKNKLSEKFDMRDLGELNYCLGIEFAKSKKHVILASQKKYIEAILKKFGMENCKSVSTPMEVGLKLDKIKPEEMDPNIPYQSLIGSLMYLAVATRPDISFAVSYLSQFNTCFGNDQWLAAKRVLRYLKGTKNLSLTYKKTGNELFGLADADWAACTIDRRSYTGYCFLFAGASISWESRKQRTVALSTAEAEYMALTEAAKEAIHLKQLAYDLGINHNKICIYNDNQAAQKLSSNPIVSAKSKHINIKEHFIRDAIKSGHIELSYRPTEDMEADILTKSVAGPKHADFRTRLGLTDITHT